MAGIYPQNRLNGLGYDNGGFVTGMDGKTLEYDVEGRLTKHVLGGTTMTYSYDGEGRRVKAEKSGTSSSLTTYVYGASGELVAEYGGTGPGNGLTFLTVDHLGSTRLVTKGAGPTPVTPANAEQYVASRHDYLPFGEEIPRGAGYGGGPTQKFTGKERDAETGLDYFGARYMASAQGRFTSPDPMFFQKEMPADPQRFNLYSYVRNNPLRYVDPTGEEIELTGDTESERQKQLAAIRSAVGKAGRMLTVVRDQSSGKYLVKVKGGDVAGFAKMNAAAAGFAEIIKSSEVAQFSFAAGHEVLPFTDSNAKPVTLSESRAVGAAGRDSGGQLHVFVLRPSECCSSIDGAKFGRSTLGGILDFLGITTVPADVGTEAGHEFGHARYLMRIGPNGRNDPAKNNQSALDLENAVRKTRDPNAPVRTVH